MPVFSALLYPGALAWIVNSPSGRCEKSKALPENHWRTAVAMSAEGAAYAGLGEFAQAETLLFESYRVLSKDEAALPAFATITAKRLAALYTNWNKPDRATTYLAILEAGESL